MKVIAENPKMNQSVVSGISNLSNKNNKKPVTRQNSKFQTNKSYKPLDTSNYLYNK